VSDDPNQFNRLFNRFFRLEEVFLTKFVPQGVPWLLNNKLPATLADAFS
jgi:hypothetical protein